MSGRHRRRLPLDAWDVVSWVLVFGLALLVLFLGVYIGRTP